MDLFILTTLPYPNLTLPKVALFILTTLPYPNLTLPKVALFRADRPDEFMAELLSRVDIEQAQSVVTTDSSTYAYGMAELRSRYDLGSI